jgi:haloalkane dehalogenase
MAILRTPDHRFQNLPGYPFEPSYVTVAGPHGNDLRLHYVDEGPPTASPVLLLHGEPSWSYLYRKMIPILVAAGFRTVAPDHIGFGRSDKLTDASDYTYERHVGWILDFVRQLDLRNITLVCQDWGGPIGLSVLTVEQERFARVVAANTILPTAQPPPNEEVADWPGEIVLQWIEFSKTARVFPVGQIAQGATVSNLPPEVVAAYDAPFPDESFKAGPRQFPAIIPTSPDDPGALRNREVWKVLERFEKPFLTAFSDRDLTTTAWKEVFCRRVPGTRGQPHATIERAGHFLQEDNGEELARVIVEWKSR